MKDLWHFKNYNSKGEHSLMNMPFFLKVMSLITSPYETIQLFSSMSATNTHANFKRLGTLRTH